MGADVKDAVHRVNDRVASQQSVRGTAVCEGHQQGHLILDGDYVNSVFHLGDFRY